MTDYNDSEFEGFEEAPPPGEPRGPSNRSFYVVVGILGAIFLISLLALVLVVMNRQPKLASERQDQAAVINAQNTVTAQAATKIAYVQLQQQLQPTATKEIAKVLNTTIASPTPVVIYNTDTPTPLVSATSEAVGIGGVPMSHTQTVAALLTLAAQGQTPNPTSAANATALPETGLMEDLGVPGMVGLAAVLIAIIFMVRRLRQ